MKRNKTKVEIELDDRELKLMNELAHQKGMSLDKTINQAIRFYQTVEERLRTGKIHYKAVERLTKDPFNKFI